MAIRSREVNWLFSTILFWLAIYELVVRSCRPLKRNVPENALESTLVVIEVPETVDAVKVEANEPQVLLRSLTVSPFERDVLTAVVITAGFAFVMLVMIHADP